MDTALRADSAPVDARPEPTPLARAARSGGVDAALGAWRTETVARRAVWDLRADAHDEEQATRRTRALAIASVGMGFLTSGLIAGAVVASLLAPTLTPAAVQPVASTPTLGVLGDGAARTPVRTVASSGAANAPVRSGVTAASLGVLGEAHAWRANGGLWVQLDYTGDPLVLRWTDGAGAVVLEPTPCVNVVSADVRRCYVGRSARRLATALADGAAPGTWTASACRGTDCASVAAWTVQ